MRNKRKKPSALVYRNATETQTRDLTVRTFQTRLQTIDEAARSVEAVLATEAPSLVFDLNTFRTIEEVLLMGGVEIPDQISLLDSHNRWSTETVRGSIREMRREGATFVGRLFFVKNDEDADRAWNKVSQGHLRDVSAGYRVLEWEDIEPGTSKVVKGKKYTAGSIALRITTKWKPFEVSLVPVGADEFSKIRSNTGGDPQKNERIMVMNPKLRTFLEKLGLRAEASEADATEFFDALEGTQRAEADNIKAGFVNVGVGAQRSATDADPPPTPDTQRGVANVPQTPPPAPIDSGEVARTAAAEAVTEERSRVQALRELAGSDISPELYQRAIDDGWDTARASREFLTEVRSSRSAPLGTPAIISHGHEQDCTVRALGAGLAQRGGLNVIDEHATKTERADQERAMEEGRRYRDMSLCDVVREALRLDGVTIPTTRNEQIRAAVSGASLTAIFTTSVNAQLMTSFLEAPDSTVGLTRDVDVADFKMNERFSLGKAGELDKLPRGDSANHVTIGDKKEEYKIARYAKQFVIDEQDIIDDSQNALLDMPQQMGKSAARLRPDLYYSILLANAALGADSIALFHSDHNNLSTSNALAALTLQAGITAVAKQTEDDVNLNLMVAFLLVPQDLFFTAEILLTSAERIISSASGGTRNPLKDMNIEIRPDNRLSAAGVINPDTGAKVVGTATNWFLAINPNQGPTIEVGYLRGTSRRPVLRSFVLDKGHWGIGWDINHDIGAKALDFRGMHKATGT